MNLLSIFQQRHSIRKYTGAPIDDAALTQIIQAGLLSASSRPIRPWEFIVVKDKDKVAKIKALYSLDGARRNTLSKGINILRMSDGKSLKKLVK